MKFPLQHISIRVPWHDSAWNGSMCQDPRRNTSCLKLVNIANGKNESAEELLAGVSLKDMNPSEFPPCVKERGTIMASFPLERSHEHPYARTAPKTHSHFRPTPLKYPAFGAAGLPFRWMLKKTVFGTSKEDGPGLVSQFPLDDLDERNEPQLDFETAWMQDHRNHRALLDCFWNHIRPEESLVFFYAKQVPLVEEAGRRVLVGAGRVLSIGPLTEYNYDCAPTAAPIRSLLWERMLVHSIRPGFQDGFLLPYQEALAKSDDGRNFDPADVVAFAPEDRFTEFSYATEHVGNDAAISALLSCRDALVRSASIMNTPIHPQEQWIDRQLGRLWKKRGPFPGMGSVLSALGVPLGNFVAQAMTDKIGEEGNPWEAWDAALENPSTSLPRELVGNIQPIIAKAWKRLPDERRQFLELLSRVDLSLEQASTLAIPELRAEQGLQLTDAQVLANPYLIYEGTRLSRVAVGVSTVDRGVFATPYVREHHPLPDVSAVQTALDGRRIRALVVRELEAAAAAGDTLRTQASVITAIRSGDDARNEAGTAVSADILAVVEEENFPGEVRLAEMSDARRAYQLERLGKAGDLIRATVNRRIEGQRHELPVDWRAELDQLLPRSVGDVEELGKEERARVEKAAALAELAAARLSVLIGPAGTGKTTLLSALCRRPEIHEGRILILAPTGKARVRIEDVLKRADTQNFQAFTLAQFLSKSKPPRYDGSAQRYLLTGATGEPAPKTVIVDESSMLTEEMMAALLESLAGVQRLIFVGDHHQLPPIGAGRPFADIIARLKPEAIESTFPRVAAGYAELTVPRRQGAGERDDLQLASWFGGNGLDPGEDQVFEILAGKRSSQTIQFFQWETPSELEELLPSTFASALNFNSELEEWQAFACSLGGELAGQYVYFNRNRSGAKSEAWQLLSPVRQKPWGVEVLNRVIHERYKAQQLQDARAPLPAYQRRFLKPQGEGQIIYGDKVINNRNSSISKARMYPQTDGPGYLANGEIGVVVGQMRTRSYNHAPRHLEIEFSTQQGTSFKFYPNQFDDDGDASLELAYALTVHKAQGSEFEIVFLVLPRSTQLLSRELLYTALTRQKSKVVVLHQGSATDLQKLSSEKYSATATRLTNLFAPPHLVSVGDAFLEDRLIHRTAREEAVRSKSEVIIANLLHSRGIDYHYEFPLEIDGILKYPDFTIEDDDSGRTYYWEHCGMLDDPSYRQRWEHKKAWYRANDILPLEEGRGARGTLIETRDQPGIGIDSPAILQLIDDVLLA